MKKSKPEMEATFFMHYFINPLLRICFDIAWWFKKTVLRYWYCGICEDLHSSRVKRYAIHGLRCNSDACSKAIDIKLD